MGDRREGEPGVGPAGTGEARNQAPPDWGPALAVKQSSVPWRPLPQGHRATLPSLALPPSREASWRTARKPTEPPCPPAWE